VHDIGRIVVHPTKNSAGITLAAMANHERRHQSGLPPTQPTSTPLIGQDPQAAVPGFHPATGRPGIDRALTVPTPPSSATTMISMGNPGSSYEWGGAPVAGVPTSQPLSIDTNLGSTRSVPTTPASTPPANALHGMTAYQSNGAYDSSRPMYVSQYQAMMLLRSY